jgi:2-polyprenyl-3-methyl-5-hydroxy-6-metoxy-1,4-benzoquinol methylase
MVPALGDRRADLVEWMDREDCDPERLRNTYRAFPWINRWVARWPALYRRRIRPVLRAVAGEERGLEGCERGRPIRLLDVGSGGGDLARDLQRWGRRDGFRLEVTGIDPDPRALAYARAAIDAEPGPVVTFRQRRASDLVAAGEKFHVVVSNHVLHHLPSEAVHGFLAELEALATHRVVVSDIERSALGYALFSGLARLPSFRNSYIRADGLLSIRRSFTRRELEAQVPAGWRVEGLWPFRLLVLRDLEGQRGTPG